MTGQSAPTFEDYLSEIQRQSSDRIHQLHHIAKRIWKDKQMSPTELQNRCLDEWDLLAPDIDSKIVPLVPVVGDRPVTNLIFGSGGFSTGDFQAQQYEEVKSYAEAAPILLQGLVANKNKSHKCNAAEIAKKHNVPLIELDFEDWYHEFINKNEPNPIAASRYWYPKTDQNCPSFTEIERRFKLRQEQFHKALGEAIAKTVKHPTDIASARGYNFQFCGTMFAHQSKLPHVNDTHPADLSYVDEKTKEKLYPGWQSGAVQLMMKDKLSLFRGSLIEVEYMNNIKQIDQLDEGALLALSAGVPQSPTLVLTADQIQSAMKIIDDNFFCTLEPTGLILMWGITEKPLPVLFQDKSGKKVIVKQRVLVVGNQFHSGINAWGAKLDTDLKEIEKFLFP
jgi:hypothetical protein